MAPKGLNYLPMKTNVTLTMDPSELSTVLIEDEDEE
jgi:hypothetical protein